MNLKQAENWIAQLEAQKKIKQITAQEFKLKLGRVAGYEQFEQEIALSSIVHEIRQRINHVETFSDLMRKKR